MQTVNDVLAGMIFHGLNLYMEEVMDPCNDATKITALVLLNTRAIRTYQNMLEMRSPNSNARWGNHFAFIHIPIPKCDKKNSKVDPLEFILKVKKLIKSKKSSFGIYLSGAFLEIIRKFRGPEVG